MRRDQQTTAAMTEALARALCALAPTVARQGCAWNDSDRDRAMTRIGASTLVELACAELGISAAAVFGRAEELEAA